MSLHCVLATCLVGPPSDAHKLVWPTHGLLMKLVLNRVFADQAVHN